MSTLVESVGDPRAPRVPGPRKCQRGGRWVAKLALLLIFSVLSVLLLEGIVRLLMPQPPSWLAVYRRHPVLDLFTLAENVTYVVESGEANWSVFTDESGYRISPDHQRNAELPISLWIGDSFTFGHGVDHAKSWIGLLNEDPDRRVEFVNAAVSAYGPVQYRQTLDYLISQGVKPRELLIGNFLGNDYFDIALSRDFPVVDGIIQERSNLKTVIKKYSHTYRLLSNMYHSFFAKSRPAGPKEVEAQLYRQESWTVGNLRQPLAMYRMEFQKIQAICKEHSINLFVMLIPSRYSVRNTRAHAVNRLDDADRTHELPRDHAVAVLTELGIGHLDLTPFLIGHATNDVYYRFNGHFTPLGHQLVYAALKRHRDDADVMETSDQE